MAYTVIFKKNMSPVNKVTKSFDATTASFDVVIKEGTSIFKPTFLLQTSTGLSDFNYIDGSSFFGGRQYFITAVRSVGYNRYEVDARTDVLSTWASEIRSNTAVIRRQENKYNLYLDDPEFKTYNTESIQTLKFKGGSGLSKNLKYILTVNGSYEQQREEITYVNT